MNYTDKASPPRWLIAAVLLLAILGTIGAVFNGPALGDHEALVAECARAMRLSGDWIVPQFVGTPFIRKPPLPYWLIAGASYVFPNDPVTGLPVTATVARLPSALAGLGTVLLLWLLALKMFGRGAGVVAGLIAGSCIFTLLYSPNATVEMLLTFCCTWAVTHFWFAINAQSGGKRFAHMMLFYVALGVGMLAKGPAPLAMVAVPIAFWWFTERPQRVLARGVSTHAKRAVWLGVRDLKDRFLHVFTRLWLIPGIIVFLAMFVPWLFAVAERHPFAWDMWNWQYLQRFEGDYEDTRVRGMLYYIPILLGLLAPWTLALFEGVVAPWIRRYALQRRGLYFAGCWAVVGTLVMSLMEFKKPYYILPAPDLTGGSRIHEAHYRVAQIHAGVYGPRGHGPRSHRRRCGLPGAGMAACLVGRRLSAVRDSGADRGHRHGAARSSRDSGRPGRHRLRLERRLRIGLVRTRSLPRFD